MHSIFVMVAGLPFFAGGREATVAVLGLIGLLLVAVAVAVRSRRARRVRSSPFGASARGVGLAESDRAAPIAVTIVPTGSAARAGRPAPIDASDASDGTADGPDSSDVAGTVEAGRRIIAPGRHRGAIGRIGWLRRPQTSLAQEPALDQSPALDESPALDQSVDDDALWPAPLTAPMAMPLAEPLVEPLAELLVEPVRSTEVDPASESPEYLIDTPARGWAYDLAPEAPVTDPPAGAGTRSWFETERAEDWDDGWVGSTVEWWDAPGSSPELELDQQTASDQRDVVPTATPDDAVPIAGWASKPYPPAESYALGESYPPAESYASSVSSYPLADAVQGPTAATSWFGGPARDGLAPADDRSAPAAEFGGSQGVELPMARFADHEPAPQTAPDQRDVAPPVAHLADSPSIGVPSQLVVDWWGQSESDAYAPRAQELPADQPSPAFEDAVAADGWWTPPLAAAVPDFITAAPPAESDPQPAVAVEPAEPEDVGQLVARILESVGATGPVAETDGARVPAQRQPGQPSTTQRAGLRAAATRLSAAPNRISVAEVTAQEATRLVEADIAALIVGSVEGARVLWLHPGDSEVEMWGPQTLAALLAVGMPLREVLDGDPLAEGSPTALLAVPVASAGTLAGTIVARRLSSRAFSLADEGVLDRLGRMCGAALDTLTRRGTFTVEGSVDEATQFGHRDRLVSDLRLALRTRDLHKMPVSLIVAEIDGLARMRTERGADEADEALGLVASTVAAQLRVGDVGYRFGDDELAVLLPATQPTDAEVVVRRLVVAADLATAHVGDDAALPLTRPLRLHATVIAVDGTAEDILTAADRALNAARIAARWQQPEPAATAAAAAENH